MKKQMALSVILMLLIGLTSCHKLSHPAASENTELTLEVIKELAKKGDALSWSDFEQYNSKEIGSGLYILRYDIDENYYLLIGGGNMQMLPLYIYLVSKADDSVSIDIRTENVEEFIDGLD